MILNIHGFQSWGANAKAAFLRETFPDVRVVSPTLPLPPNEALSVLEAAVRDAGEPLEMVVGSSLGGFYAYVLCCRRKVPAVLINPAVVPFIHLAEMIGPVENFYTKETAEWTREHCLALKDLFCATAYRAESSLVHAFVATDDETLEPRLARDFFRFHGTLVEVSWGTHRFEGLDRIRNDIARIYAAARKAG